MFTLFFGKSKKKHKLHTETISVGDKTRNETDKKNVSTNLEISIRFHFHQTTATTVMTMTLTTTTTTIDLHRDHIKTICVRFVVSIDIMYEQHMCARVFFFLAFEATCAFWCYPCIVLYPDTSRCWPVSANSVYFGIALFTSITFYCAVAAATASSIHFNNLLK